MRTPVWTHSTNAMTNGAISPSLPHEPPSPELFQMPGHRLVLLGMPPHLPGSGFQRLRICHEFSVHSRHARQ